MVTVLKESDPSEMCRTRVLTTLSVAESSRAVQYNACIDAGNDTLIPADQFDNLNNTDD